MCEDVGWVLSGVHTNPHVSIISRWFPFSTCWYWCVLILMVWTVWIWTNNLYYPIIFLVVFYPVELRPDMSTVIKVFTPMLSHSVWTISKLYNGCLVVVEGFEPTITEVKALCLTTWRHHIKYISYFVWRFQREDFCFLSLFYIYYTILLLLCQVPKWNFYFLIKSLILFSSLFKSCICFVSSLNLVINLLLSSMDMFTGSFGFAELRSTLYSI